MHPDDKTTPSLDGVKAKIDRAKQHANDFEAAYKAWRSAMAGQPPNSMERGSDPKRPVITISSPPVDAVLPLIVGDCVHNLRSSLDHLAAQLAVKNGHSIGVSRQLGFPIFLNESGYQQRGRNKVKPFVSADALAAIEAAQPYHWAGPEKEARNDPLWVLSELDNIDKHRTLVVVIKRLRRKDVLETRDPEELNKFEHAPVPRGSDLMFFQVQLWPATEPTPHEGAETPLTIMMKVDATLVFANTGLTCDGVPFVNHSNSCSLGCKGS